MTRFRTQLKCSVTHRHPRKSLKYQHIFEYRPVSFYAVDYCTDALCIKDGVKIDPPYNTGNDFVYNDDFSVESGVWSEELSGDYDDCGNRLVKNLDSNGRFHTDWLNMLYPRLRLAKDLLTDDGVIFISIDDNEVENLTKIGKEIFGNGNYINALKWKRKKQPSFLSRHIAPLMEYILIFAKNSESLGKLSTESVSDDTKKVINISNQESERIFKAGVEVKDVENGVIPKGKYTVKTMTVEYLNDVIVQNYHTVSPITVKSKFLNTQEKIDEFIDNHLLYITAAKGLRRYVSPNESNKEKSIADLLLDWGDNQDSEKEQKDIFGTKYFDYAKPVQLIYNLTKSCVADDSIILDFFSGSATTAHAVMQLNAEEAVGGGTGNSSWYSCLRCATKRARHTRRDTRTYAKSARNVSAAQARKSRKSLLSPQATLMWVSACSA